MMMLFLLEGDKVLCMGVNMQQLTKETSCDIADSAMAHTIRATDSLSPILTAHVEEPSTGRETSLDIRTIAAPRIPPSSNDGWL